MKLGAYDDTVNVQSGAIGGAIDFGAGDNTLSISGGGFVNGKVTRARFWHNSIFPLRAPN